MLSYVRSREQILLFICGNEEQKVYGMANADLQEELRQSICISARHLNEKMRKHKWMAFLRKLFLRKPYKYLEEEDVISDDDVSNTYAEVNPNRDSFVITLTLRSEPYPEKWFHKLLKTFTVRQYFLMEKMLGD